MLLDETGHKGGLDEMPNHKYFVAKLHVCKCCEGTGEYGVLVPDGTYTCPVCHGAGKMPEWVPLKEALKETQKDLIEEHEALYHPLWEREYTKQKIHIKEKRSEL